MDGPFEFKASDWSDEAKEASDGLGGLPAIGPSALDVTVAAPYLDVISIGSPGLLPVNQCDEHSRLLFEPVAVPALNHTGLRTTLEKLQDELGETGAPGAANREEHPYFYPDGRKKKNFRADVRQAFRKAQPGIYDQHPSNNDSSASADASAASSAPSDGDNSQQLLLSSDADRALVLLEARRAAVKSKRNEGHITHRGMSSAASASRSEVSRSLALRRSPALGSKPARESDVKARSLLSSIRKDRQRINSLCMN